MPQCLALRHPSPFRHFPECHPDTRQALPQAKSPLAMRTLTVLSHCTNSRFFTDCYLEEVLFQTGCGLATGTSMETNRRPAPLETRRRPIGDYYTIVIIRLICWCRDTVEPLQGQQSASPKHANGGRGSTRATRERIKQCIIHAIKKRRRRGFDPRCGATRGP